jgi:hypothetical protein
MTFRWTRPPTQAWQARVYIVVLEASLERLLWSFAPRIEADAKINASWTDRTANARQTLASFVYQPGASRLALVLKQHMSYGVFLELCNQGRYAIVLRTLQSYYGPLWNSVKELVE